MKRTKYNRPNYSDHRGLIVHILGWEAAEEGEGVFPFLKAVKTYDPNKGGFSTWLFHNLVLHKKRRFAKKKIEFCELEDYIEDNSTSQPQHIIEFRNTVTNLSKEAKIVINFILENQGQKCKRDRWNSSSVSTACEIRNQIKQYCKNDLGWGSTKYRKTIQEIKEILK